MNAHFDQPKNRERLKTDLPLLQQNLEKCPWWSTGHILKTLNESSTDKSRLFLEKTFCYGGERSWLLYSIQNQHSPSLTETPEEQDLKDAAADADALVLATDEIEQQPLAESSNPISSESDKNSPPDALSGQEKTEKSEQLLFEPYHTVDYFASQGIRLRVEKLGDDKLSTQVKTFTQWLKSMKKIYVEDKGELEAKEENKVLQIADQSNKEEPVITETMAQVLIQQGKKAKAAELYQKLSLLHPEKSSYFAALISNLNR
jgi:hypothetical protein